MRKTEPWQRVALLLAIAAATLGAGISDLDREVVTLTTDADGTLRERRIWFAELDGSLFIRTTPRATWGQNVARTGDVELRAGEQTYAFAAVRVDAPADLDRIHERFREKYGRDDWWADRLRFFFGGKVTYRLEPLPEP
ncbi:MAG: hypothetical protein AAF430_01060 [Myxococcota bacterium]